MDGIEADAFEEPIYDTLANEADEEDTTQEIVVTVAEAVTITEKWLLASREGGVF